MKAKRVFAAILSAMMIMSFMAGCSGNTADVDNSSSETSVSDTENGGTEVIDAQEASGTVKELSQSKLVLTLEDEMEVQFKLDDIEIPAELEIGDTITVNYTEADGVMAISGIQITPEKDDTESKPEETPSGTEDTEGKPEEKPADSSKEDNKTESGSTEVDYSSWTQQEKAAYLFSDAHWVQEISNWTIPCTSIGENNTGIFFDQKGVEFPAIVHFGPLYREKKVEFGYGYNDAAECEISIIRLFNDYLGLPTDLTSCDLAYSDPSSYTETDEKPESKPDDKPSGETKPPVEENKNNGDKGSSEAGDVYEAIELINKERVKAGLGELEIDDTLMEMAAVRAEELVWGYSQEPKKAHTRPDGSDWKTVFDDYGIKVTNKRGENAFRAKNLSDAKTAVDAWMNSSGHKANILQKEISKIGVGYYAEGPQNYWIMIVTE